MMKLYSVSGDWDIFVAHKEAFIASLLAPYVKRNSPTAIIAYPRSITPCDVATAFLTFLGSRADSELAEFAQARYATLILQPDASMKIVFLKKR